VRADAGAPVPLGGLLLRGGGPRAAAPPAGARHALHRGQAPAHHQGAPLSFGAPRGQGSTGELWSSISPLGVDCAIENGILKRAGLTLGLETLQNRNACRDPANLQGTHAHADSLPAVPGDGRGQGRRQRGGLAGPRGAAVPGAAVREMLRDGRCWVSCLWDSLITLSSHIDLWPSRFLTKR